MRVPSPHPHLFYQPEPIHTVATAWLQGCTGCVPHPRTGWMWTTSAQVTSCHRPLARGAVFSCRRPFPTCWENFSHNHLFSYWHIPGGAAATQFPRNGRPCLAKPRSLQVLETLMPPKTAHNGVCAHFIT